MNQLRLWVAVLVLLTLTACSTQASRTGDTASPAGLGDAAVSPQETYPQIEFNRVAWLLGRPGTPAGSGVWVYTDKEQLPDAGISWNRYDLLLLKLPGGSHDGHRLRVDAIQVIAPDVVRIVVRTEPDPEQKVAGPPAAWLTVQDGALDGKRFVLASAEYEAFRFDSLEDPAEEQTKSASLPNRTYSLIAYDKIAWFGGKPELPEGHGVWVYTDKEQRPDAGISWKMYDLLLVKLPADAIQGKQVRIREMQVIAPDVVRIVVRLELAEAGKQDGEAPAVWVTVRDGALDGKRLIVVDEEYRPLIGD